jgi:hypothetical protein
VEPSRTLPQATAAALVVQSALIAFYAAMLPSPFPLRGLPLVHAAAEAAIKLSLAVLAGFVIKDVLLVGLLLAALACLQRSGTSPRPARWLAATAFLFALSLVIRPTNFVMMAVLAVAIVPLAWRTWQGRAAALGLAFAALLMTLPISALFNAYATNARKDHAEIQLILFDLAGISARTGRDMLGELPGWPAGLPDPRLCYTPSEAAIIAPWSPCRGYAEAGRTVYSTGRRRVIEWWLRSIAADPLAYLSHRLDIRAICWIRSALREDTRSTRPPRGPAGRYLYALNQPGAAERLEAQTQGRIPSGRFLTWHGNAAARGLAGLTNLIVGFRGTPVAALLISLLLLGWTWVRHWRGRPLPPLTVPAAASLAAGNFLMHALAGVASQERYLIPPSSAPLSPCSSPFAGLCAKGGGASQEIFRRIVRVPRIVPKPSAPAAERLQQPRRHGLVGAAGGTAQAADRRGDAVQTARPKRRDIAARQASPQTGRPGQGAHPPGQAPVRREPRVRRRRAKPGSGGNRKGLIASDSSIAPRKAAGRSRSSSYGRTRSLSGPKAAE